MESQWTSQKLLDDIEAKFKQLDVEQDLQLQSLYWSRLDA